MGAATPGQDQQRQHEEGDEEHGHDCERARQLQPLQAIGERIAEYLRPPRRAEEARDEEPPNPAARAGLTWTRTETRIRRVAASAAGALIGVLLSQGRLFLAGPQRSLPALAALGAAGVDHVAVARIDGDGVECLDRLGTPDACQGHGRFALLRSGPHALQQVHQLPGACLAGQLADKLLEKGVYVIGFSFPVVPRGQARIRTQISAVHSQDDLDFASQAPVAQQTISVTRYLKPARETR